MKNITSYLSSLVTSLAAVSILGSGAFGNTVIHSSTQKRSLHLLQELIGPSHVRDRIIALPAGVFRIVTPLRLTAAQHVVLRGDPGGGTEIRGSVLYPARRVRAGEEVPPGLRAQHVLVIDADEQLQRLWRESGETSVGCKAGSLIALYQGRRRLSCARWPEQGYATATTVINKRPSELSFFPPPDKVRDWAESKAISVGGYFAIDWYYEVADAKIDQLQGTLLAALKQRYVPQPPFRYFVQGSPTDLSKSGHYVSDPPGGRIFFIPFQSGEELPDIEIPVAARLLDVRISSQITVDNISFSHSVQDGIHVENSLEVDLRNVCVSNVAGTGISVKGGEHVNVSRSLITKTGGTGVLLSGGNRSNLLASRHQITESVLTKTSQRERTYHPAVQLDGVGNAALDNVISDLPHIAIGFAGNDHRISGNEITRAVNETSDAGAIYAGRDWTWRGTEISYNYLHDIVPVDVPTEINYEDAKKREVKGVYLDDMLSGTKVLGNIFVRVQKPIFIGGGRDNEVRENLFISPVGPAMHLDDRGLSYGGANNKESIIRRRLLNVPYDRGIYAEKYPALPKILTQEPALPLGNRFSHNTTFQGKMLELLGAAKSTLSSSENLEFLGPTNTGGSEGILSNISSLIPDFESSRYESVRKTIRRVEENRKNWATVSCGRVRRR